MFTKTFTLMALAAVVAPAFCAEWIGDFEAAKAKAKAEKKALLVDFTGSDWCGNCIALRKNVFDTPEFEAYAKDKFVLAEVDVPRGNKISAEQKKKNNELVKKYAVDGFPTILVMTATGKAVGGFVGRKDSFSQVQPALDKGYENVKALKKANKAKDAKAKLQAMADVYRNIPKDVKPCATDLRNDLKKADPDDKMGVVNAEASAQEQAQMLEAKLGELFGNPNKSMMKEVKAMEPGILPENKVDFLTLKMSAMLLDAGSVAEVEKARDILLKDAESLTDKKEEVTEQIKKQFANPAETLKQMQDFKAQNKK